MKAGKKSLLRYQFQVNGLLVVIINIHFGGYDALVYVGGQVHSFEVKNLLVTGSWFPVV
jgi:hypothetical protein